MATTSSSRASRGATRARSGTIQPNPKARQSRAGRTKLTEEQQQALGSFPPPTAYSEQMAVENFKLAMHRANLFAARTRMPLEDIEIVAWVGLLNACRRWDPNTLNPATGQPYRISTLAVRYIDGAMRRWLRDKMQTAGVRFPIAWRDKLPSAKRLAGEGRSFEQIGRELGMDAADVQMMLHATGPSSELPADLSLADDGSEWQDGQLELGLLRDLAERSLRAMTQADQRLLLSWWGQASRRSIPSRLNQQFRGRLSAILRLQSRGAIGPVPTLRSPVQLSETAVQLGLLDREN